MVQIAIFFDKSVCGHTIIAKKAKRFLGLEWNEGSNEVVDNGCDEDNEQEDLGLRGNKVPKSIANLLNI